MTDSALLRLSGATLGYGRRRVLTAVSLEVRPGEQWFLLGPNGQGKTTLLRALLGLLKPLEGQMVYAPCFKAGAHIAFVPQRCELNPTLPTTVREFVSHGFVGLGLPRVERDRRLAEVLEQVSLPAAPDTGFWTLSGGQRQRALLARALVRKPRLLILDEPASGLDLPGEEQLTNCLARLHRSGLAMLHVTHDLAMAAAHATHIALVYGGHVRAGVRDAWMTGPCLTAAYRVPIEVQRDPHGCLRVSRREAAAP